MESNHPGVGLPPPAGFEGSRVQASLRAVKPSARRMGEVHGKLTHRRGSGVPPSSRPPSSTFASLRNRHEWP
jgi:hypothetical protein